MNPFKIFTTPEYLFRPTQIWTRISRSLQNPRECKCKVSLPWGDKIIVQPIECIGCGIWYYGIFDLLVAEALARLADSGDHVLDIGANIGQMTSLLQRLVGNNGRVDSFEPHPAVLDDLMVNVDLWSKRYKNRVIKLHGYALGNDNAMVQMVLPDSWNTNKGIGRLANAIREESPNGPTVEVKKIDSVFQGDFKISVCKIDVEGHEIEVLKGARSMLEAGKIRNVIFEDLDFKNSQVSEYLEGFGYRVFSLKSNVFGPVLDSTLSGRQSRISDGNNYLATLDPDRALDRFFKKGWNVLRYSWF